MDPVRHVRRSYPAKLLLLVSVVAVLVAGIGGVIYLQAGQAMAADTERTVEQSTQLQASNVGDWLDGVTDRTRTLASSEAVRSGDEDRVAAALSRAADQLPAGAETVHYVDPETGAVLASSDVGLDAAADGEPAYAGADWLRTVEEGEVRVTDPFAAPTVDGAAIAVVADVPGRDRLVVAPVDLEARSATLESPAASEGAFTHVVAGDGTVVLSQHRGTVGTDAVDGLDRAFAGGAGVFEAGVDGRREVVGYAPVDGTDWVVTTRVPASSAYALQTQLRRAMLGLLVVAVLGVAAVGVVVGRNTTQDLAELAETTRAIEEGALDADLETDRVDEIGQLYESFDSMRASLRAALTEAETARRRASSREERLSTLAREVEATAASFESVLERAAAGDLTGRLDDDVETEELARIAREYNETIASFEETTDRLRRFAGDVAAHSEEVTASAQEVRSASEQVSVSIQDISETTERQAETFDEVADRVGDVSSTTQSIAARADDVEDVAEETADTGARGKESARDAVMAMESIDASSESAAAEMAELEDLVAEIDEVAEFIAEVAEEVNVLALNANIEASRSADADDGEGFTVVAHEVKDLAAETKRSAQRIESLVEEVQAQTDRSVEEVQSTREAVTEGRETVDEAIRALDEIADYAAETLKGVAEISRATESQAESTEDVVSMVDHATSLSREVEAEAENVAAAAQEQTSAIVEVSESAEQLSGEAQALRDALDRFRTDVEGDVDEEGWLPEPPAWDRSGTDRAEVAAVASTGSSTDAADADGDVAATPMPPPESATPIEPDADGGSAGADDGPTTADPADAAAETVDNADETDTDQADETDAADTADAAAEDGDDAPSDPPERAADGGRSFERG